MDYENMSDDALYWRLKQTVPEMAINKVDESNRNTVIAVLKITEGIRQRSEAVEKRPNPVPE